MQLDITTSYFDGAILHNCLCYMLISLKHYYLQHVGIEKVADFWIVETCITSCYLYLSC